MAERSLEPIGLAGRAVDQDDLVGPRDVGHQVGDGIAVHARGAAGLDDRAERHYGCSPGNSRPTVSG